MKPGHLRTTISHDSSDIARYLPQIGPQGWVILETYPSITFRRWALGEAFPELGSEFAGRIFGPGGELRWLREGDHFDLWFLEDGAGGGTDVQVEERYYYGVGYGSNQRYWEPKLPLDRLKYPLDTVEDGARPRFLVREYYRTIPTEWPTDLDAFEDLVNQPLLFAYRFVAFDAGKDGK